MEGPRDVILESNEKILLATRPLFLWEPLVTLDIALFVLSLYFSPLVPPLAALCLGAFVLLTIWILFRWIPWSAKWFVLTDRRADAPRGGVHPNQTPPPPPPIPDAGPAPPLPPPQVRRLRRAAP